MQTKTVLRGGGGARVGPGLRSRSPLEQTSSSSSDAVTYIRVCKKVLDRAGHTSRKISNFPPLICISLVTWWFGPMTAGCYLKCWGHVMVLNQWERTIDMTSYVTWLNGGQRSKVKPLLLICRIDIGPMSFRRLNRRIDVGSMSGRCRIDVIRRCMLLGR